MKPALLLVDDDETISFQMKWALADAYDVVTACDRSSAVNVFRAQLPEIVLLDLGLPPAPADPTEGLATLTDLLALDPMVKIIVVSGQNEKANALRAIGEGAYDFVAKPIDMDVLKPILSRGFYVAQLEREYRRSRQGAPIDGFEGMVGGSPAMQEVFSLIRKVATTDASVLVLGESGTGKEMAARAIHRCSSRKNGPFIPINCGAIPENLLESELFGHERGAFTGAHAARRGRIEAAAGGTLFLDEIGELPLNLQVKILRFLQEQTLERVGGRVQIHIDTRVIAATNADLVRSMSQGTFREDLYYRLAVVVINVPALRSRPADIALLAKTFLFGSAAEHRRRVTRFSTEAMNALLRHAWPGNVRELKNRVCRAVIMADGTQVTAADLDLVETTADAPPIRTLKQARESIERAVIEEALRRHNQKIAPAAAELGISRPTFYELLEKLGLRKGETNSKGGSEVG